MMPLLMRFARAGPRAFALVLPEPVSDVAHLGRLAVVGGHRPQELSFRLGRPLPPRCVEPDVELLLALGDPEGGVVERDVIGSGSGVPDCLDRSCRSAAAASG
jgi:hypothetical protein